jgi:two-component system, chemotaxis family, response regulator PixH
MKTVLVVEDTLSEQELIGSYLREAGYLVMMANEAREALGKIETQLPDVIVTDIVMSGISGLEFCRILRKKPETRLVPIIACTSKNQDIDRLWGLRQGINIYVAKPFTSKQLIQAVKSVTEG